MKIIDYIVLCWIVISCFNKTMINYLIASIIFTGTIVCFLGILFIIISPGAEFRAYSTFYQSDAFAGYLLIIIPLAICLANIKLSFWIRVYLMVSCVIFISSLLLTQSRGAMLCIMAIIFILLAGLRKHSFGLVVFKMAFFLVFAFLFIHFFPSATKQSPISHIINRVNTISDSETSPDVMARFDFWEGAAKISLDKPFFGCGLGNFGRFFPKYQKNVRYFSHYTHNYYLQIAAETGLVGFVFFMLIILTILWWGGKLIFMGDFEDHKSYIISLGLFSGILASMMHSFLDVDWNFPSIPLLFWIEIGMFFVLISHILPKREFKIFQSRLFLTTSKFVLGFLMIFSLLLFYTLWIADIEYDKGKEYQKEGKIRETITCYSNAIRFDPLNGEYYRVRGRLFYDLSNRSDSPDKYLDMAIKDLEEAVSLDPYKAAYHSDLGYTYLSKYYNGKKDYYEKIKTQFELAVANDPINYPQFYNILAQLYLLKGEPHKAKEYYLKGANIMPDVNEINLIWDFRREPLKNQLISVNNGLAQLCLSLKKPDEARIYFLRVIQLEDKNFDALYGTGLALFNERKYTQAEIYLLDAVDLYGTPECYYLLGLIKRNMDNQKKAKEYLNKSLKLKDDFVPSLIELGHIYVEEGDVKSGKSLWEKALKCEPHNSTLKDLLKK